MDPSNVPLDPVHRIKMSKTAKMLAMSPQCPADLARKPDWCLNDFVLVKKLGVGGASAVYQGLLRTSGLSVALKLYFKSKMTPLNVHQVHREVAIHVQLSHPNIIDLYGAFEDQEHVVLVIDHATQGDLFDLLRAKGGRMKEATVATRIMHPFMSGLYYLHSRNIIHRDIKLENTLFDCHGGLKVADFGLSIDTSQEHAVTRLGTLDYMSPEVMICPDKRLPGENKDQPRLAYTSKVDSWACGVLAYELLVGCPPFGMSTREASVKAIVCQQPKLPSFLPPDAQEFILWALEKSAEQRPSVVELIQHRWITSHMAASQPQHAAPPSYEPRGAHALPHAPSYAPVPRSHSMLRARVDDVHRPPHESDMAQQQRVPHMRAACRQHYAPAPHRPAQQPCGAEQQRLEAARQLAHASHAVAPGRPVQQQQQMVPVSRLSPMDYSPKQAPGEVMDCHKVHAGLSQDVATLAQQLNCSLDAPGRGPPPAQQGYTGAVPVDVGAYYERAKRTAALASILHLRSQQQLAHAEALHRAALQQQQQHSLQAAAAQPRPTGVSWAPPAAATVLAAGRGPRGHLAALERARIAAPPARASPAHSPAALRHAQHNPPSCQIPPSANLTPLCVASPHFGSTDESLIGNFPAYELGPKHFLSAPLSGSPAPPAADPPQLSAASAQIATPSEVAYSGTWPVLPTPTGGAAAPAHWAHALYASPPSAHASAAASMSSTGMCHSHTSLAAPPNPPAGCAAAAARGTGTSSTVDGSSEAQAAVSPAPNACRAWGEQHAPHTPGPGPGPPAPWGEDPSSSARHAPTGGGLPHALQPLAARAHDAGAHRHDAAHRKAASSLVEVARRSNLLPSSSLTTSPRAAHGANRRALVSSLSVPSGGIVCGKRGTSSRDDSGDDLDGAGTNSANEAEGAFLGGASALHAASAVAHAEHSTRRTTAGSTDLSAGFALHDDLMDASQAFGSRAHAELSAHQSGPEGAQVGWADVLGDRSVPARQGGLVASFAPCSGSGADCAAPAHSDQACRATTGPCSRPVKRAITSHMRCY